MRRWLRRRARALVPHLDALALNSTSTLLFAVALIATLSAIDFRPSVSFPAVVPGQYEGTGTAVTFQGPAPPEGLVRVVQRTVAHTAGRGDQVCWSRSSLGLSGDVLTGAMGPWSLGLSVPERARILVIRPEDGQPVPPEQVGLNVDRAPPDPTAQGRDEGLALAPVRLHRPPEGRTWPADAYLFVLLEWNDASLPNCSGPPDRIVDQRGATLLYSPTPIEVVALSPSGEPFPSGASARIALEAEFQLDGLSGYRVESGPEPTETAEGFSWSGEALSTRGRSSGDRVSAEIVRHSSLRDIVAESPAAKAAEDRNLFISGILFGIAAAGLVGALQELLNARRQRAAYPDRRERVRELQTLLFESERHLHPPARARRGASVRSVRLVGLLLLLASAASLAGPRVSAAVVDATHAAVPASSTQKVLGIAHLVALLALLVLMWRTAATGRTTLARRLTTGAIVLLGLELVVAFLWADDRLQAPVIQYAVHRLTYALAALGVAACCLKAALVGAWGRSVRGLILGAGTVAAGASLAAFLTIVGPGRLLWTALTVLLAAAGCVMLVRPATVTRPPAP